MGDIPEMPSSDPVVREYKRAEAEARIALLAAGQNGAWPWPAVTPEAPNLIDDDWRCELELGGA
jgi:hypothetical protein